MYIYFLKKFGNIHSKCPWAFQEGQFFPMNSGKKTKDIDFSVTSENG